MEEFYNEEVKNRYESSNKLIFGVILLAVVLGCVLFACQHFMKSVPYEPGKIIDEENVYVNDFFHIRFECPDGYRMNRVQMTDGDLKNVFGNQYNGNVDDVYQELKVEANGSLSSMNINVGKGSMNLMKKSGLNRLQNIMQSTFSQVGNITVDLGEPYEDYLGGQTYQAVDFNIDAEGYPMRFTIFTKIEKGYTIMICLSEINESVNDLFEGFVEYK